jgi:hypothetical protein
MLAAGGPGLCRSELPAKALVAVAAVHCWRQQMAVRCMLAAVGRGNRETRKRRNQGSSQRINPDSSQGLCLGSRSLRRSAFNDQASGRTKSPGSIPVGLCPAPAGSNTLTVSELTCRHLACRIPMDGDACGHPRPAISGSRRGGFLVVMSVAGQRTLNWNVSPGRRAMVGWICGHDRS